MDSIDLDCSPANLVTDDMLELRDGEDNVSFFWSHYSHDIDKILHTLNELSIRRPVGSKFSTRSGMLKIDAIEAMDSINFPKKLIRFECTDESPTGCIHHGLFFETDDVKQLLEIRSSIVELSDFFVIKKLDKTQRELLSVNDTGKACMLGTFPEVHSQSLRNIV
ncbi:hypothetical protein V2K30_08160 [Pseudomonas alliivorans]|nr:hypothetical protein [Pseudomonas alliivorans]MEE4909010.1 hypothetical protein [Pseudomonas alliivorans]